MQPNPTSEQGTPADPAAQADHLTIQACGYARMKSRIISS